MGPLRRITVILHVSITSSIFIVSCVFLIVAHAHEIPLAHTPRNTTRSTGAPLKTC